MARPTVYKPSLCEKVVEYGKMGKSVAWMAAELGVSKQTLHNWTQEHPEFLDAFTRAKLESQRWWEDVGQEHVVARPGEGSLNAGVYARSMAARFPEDWRENKGVELSGGIQHDVILEVVGVPGSSAR